MAINDTWSQGTKVIKALQTLIQEMHKYKALQGAKPKTVEVMVDLESQAINLVNALNNIG